MNIRSFVLSYTKAKEDTLEARRKIVRWGEITLICFGWMLGSTFDWFWVMVGVAFIGLYSLVKTVRAAFRLNEFEDAEYAKWAKIDEASLFDNVPELSSDLLSSDDSCEKVVANNER